MMGKRSKQKRKREGEKKKKKYKSKRTLRKKGTGHSIETRLSAHGLFFVNTSKTKFRETKAGKGGAPLINGVVLLEMADGTANERSVMFTTTTTTYVVRQMIQCCKAISINDEKDNSVQ
jgi:hypothetical protein